MDVESEDYEALVRLAEHRGQSFASLVRVILTADWKRQRR